MHVSAMTRSGEVSVSVMVASEEVCIIVVAACRVVQDGAWTCQCRGSEQACIGQSSVSVWGCAHRCSGGAHVLCALFLCQQVGPCISVQCQLLGLCMLL